VAHVPARPPTLERLRAYGAERLARYKLPEDLTFLDALPLTPMDKVDRRALAQSLTPVPDPARPGPR
jgi:non-ribosomal peptide synthetase component E (peptide arylation enzyme)